MIRKYPAGDHDRDTRWAPKRNTNPTFGEYGAIVYIYKLSLEHPSDAGKFYHPVDTSEEASYWLDYYTEQTKIYSWRTYPLYIDAYFVPTGPS